MEFHAGGARFEIAAVFCQKNYLQSSMALKHFFFWKQALNQGVHYVHRCALYTGIYVSCGLTQSSKRQDNFKEMN